MPREEVVSYQPLTISIVATGRCTLSCDMCPTHSHVIPGSYPYLQEPTKDVSFEVFKDIVDTFPRALNVQIIGSGEPLLNKDLFKMIEYAVHAKHMKVKTFSNGTTIEENIGRIIASPLHGITISLNGHRPEEFQRMTGCPGHLYASIYSAAKRLIEARNGSDAAIRVSLSFIIDKENFTHIPEMIERGREIGCDYIYFCNFLPSPYDGYTADERMLFADSPEAQEIKDIYGRLPHAIRKKVAFPALIDRHKAFNGCKTHFTQIRVDGEGRISSCSIMLLNMSGNGRFSDNDAWNNEFFRNKRREFLSHDPSLLKEPCRTCPENYGVYIDA